MQNYGESLKDAWVTLHEMDGKDPNPTSEAKLKLSYYFGLED
jgi:hypothetical protein